MDIGLDIKERAAVSHIVRPLEVAMTLTNDYFSYPKEKVAHSKRNVSGNMFNAVPILMAQHAISENDALAFLKQKILEAEDEHRVELGELEQKGPLSRELKRYITACQMATAGFHFWHASAPRYERPSVNGHSPLWHSRSLGRTVVSWFRN